MVKQGEGPDKTTMKGYGGNKHKMRRSRKSLGWEIRKHCSVRRLIEQTPEAWVKPAVWKRRKEVSSFAVRSPPNQTRKGNRETSGPHLSSVTACMELAYFATWFQAGYFSSYFGG